MRFSLLLLGMLVLATSGLTACSRVMSYDEATGQSDLDKPEHWQEEYYGRKPWERNNNSN